MGFGFTKATLVINKEKIPSRNLHHQNIWNNLRVDMMCINDAWSLKRDLPQVGHARKIIKKIVFGGFQKFNTFYGTNFSKKSIAQKLKLRDENYFNVQSQDAICRHKS